MNINRQSYEEFFILYADGELNENEKKAVEEFIDSNPDLAGEFHLIRETVMIPDNSIIFENKEILFKDEDEEKKIIYMRWFRIAAAAVILIAFSVIGWVFLSDSDINKEPMAVIKPPEINKPEMTEAAQSKESIDENSMKGSEKNIQERKDPAPVNSSEKQRRISEEKTVPQNEKLPENIKDPINEPDVAIHEPSETTPEGTAFTQDVVTTEPVRETIDMAVEPREMENNQELPAEVVQTPSFPQETGNDIIYFANTSLTKKTKLRGVLRKATRYLDRVTSLQ